MKISALIYRGQLVEMAPVPDDFQFGEHGSHFHVEVKAVEKHMCEDSPVIVEEPTNEPVSVSAV